MAALAFLSPICALSVSLFAARVGQHMILVLVAAPLIAGALPLRTHRMGLWASAAAFMIALWVWHMPVPYDATFHSDAIYWAMHLSLFGTALWLWHELLNHRPVQAFQAVAAGVATTVQMSVLGAILALAGRPFFTAHLATSRAWGLSPMADQQLGGLLMWVPGCILFLWAALRSMRMLAGALQPEPSQ